MNWTELYPIVKDQAYCAVMRYDPRRADKLQELICQAYQLFKSNVDKGKPINKNHFKQFITKRSREVDFRSICPKGTGGTSALDPLSFVNRRSTSPITLLEFNDWITFNPKSKELVEANMAFGVDYKNWLDKLSDMHKRILEYLIQGFTVTNIAKILNEKTTKIRQIIKELRQNFIRCFHAKPLHA